MASYLLSICLSFDLQASPVMIALSKVNLLRCPTMIVLAVAAIMCSTADAQSPQDEPSAEQRARGDAAADTAADPEKEFQFLGPDGKPLPAEIQAQLRKQIKDNPPQIKGENGTIIVTRRTLRGSIPFDDVPERSFSQLDLKAFGADSVEDLVDILGPRLTSPTARDGAAPVLLLNGRRAASPLDIAQLPTEAIERLEVFPEQLAAQYGLRSDVKVLNIVTFEQYTSVFALGNGRIASEGGFASGNTALDLIKLDKDLRIGLGLSYTRSSDLTEEERDVVQPVVSEGQALVRNLLPDIELIDFNGNLSNPLSQNASASVTGRYRVEKSNALAGAMKQSVLLRSSVTRQLDLGANLAQQLDKFLLSFNTSLSDLTRKAEVSFLNNNSIIDSSEFSRLDFLADINLSGGLVELPQGLLSGSAILEVGNSEADSFALNAVPELRTERARDFARASLGVNIPILKNDSGIGRLQASFDGTITTLSDVNDTHAVNASLDWAISKSLRLSLFWSHQSLPPSLEQLADPRLVSPNIRTLDFIRGETVDVAFVTGGNPDLLNEDRQDYQFRLSAQPFARLDLTLSATFSSTSSDNLIATFPLLTTATTNAFPDRFARSPTGELTGIDVRPVNFLRSSRDQIFWGFSFSRPLGALAKGYQPQGQAIRSAEEARQAFPDSVILTAPPSSALSRQAENLSSRVFFNLYHTWFTRDRVRLSQGSPVLDLLDGDAIDFLGGRRQHRIELDAGVYRDGFGFRVDADWSSGTSLDEVTADGTSQLVFGDFAVFDVSVFVNLAEAFDVSNRKSWLKGTRVTFEVENLFNQRPGVKTPDGSTPLRFQGAFLDPLGQTVFLSLRKSF